MGFLDKVKNLFTEEYEVEEQKPIKKEMVQVEIPAPVEDVKFELPKRREVVAKPEENEFPKENYQREEYQREIKREEIRKPVFFDDKDFLDLEKPKEIKKQAKIEAKKETTYGTKKVEEKKKFSPTPIISPVYGILDKNYHKEDITTKNTTSRLSYKSSKKITVDEVRNKAFGTLEDDLETTLVNTPIIDEKDYNIKKIEPISDELFADLADDSKPRHSNDDIEVTEDDEINKNLTIEELENLEKTKTRTRRSKKVTVEATEDTISNSELFDLIDSMYDRKDE